MSVNWSATPLRPPSRTQRLPSPIASFSSSSEPGVAYPRPGGEPLYKMAAVSVGSRRLPGMTQPNVLPIASILLRRYNDHRTAARRDVPGSRLLQTDRAAIL